jgi:hypothetical protein
MTLKFCPMQFNISKTVPVNPEGVLPLGINILIISHFADLSRDKSLDKTLDKLDNHKILWYNRKHRRTCDLINLIYIRAAIRANTGIDLPIPKVLQYLVEEGLVTPAQAKDPDLIFRGYSEYFDYDSADISDDEVDGFVLLEDEDL